MSKIRQFIKTHLWSKVFVAFVGLSGVLGISAQFVDFLKKEICLSFGWLVFILLGMIFICLIFFDLVWNNSKKLPFADYKEDLFSYSLGDDQLKYKWQYKEQSNGKWCITQITAYCSTHNLRINSMICDECKDRVSFSVLKDAQIKSYIERKILQRYKGLEPKDYLDDI